MIQIGVRYTHRLSRFQIYRHLRVQKQTKTPFSRAFSGSTTRIFPYGESFTGALGIGNEGLKGSRQCITPHDVEFTKEVQVDGGVQMEVVEGGGVESVRCGWGHTAFVRDGCLYIAGKPHDFQTLLRMNRLPSFAVNFMNFMLTNFSINLGVEEDEKETVAAGMMKTTPTLYKVPEGVKVSSKVAVSAGLTAFISQDGELYCFGLSNYGQCGNGTEVNNVWEPERVLGLHSSLGTPLSATLPSEKKLKELKEIGSEAKIVDVDVGLQHGACCDEIGNVYAWGKGERGQLGLWADGGNTSYAGKVRLQRGRDYDRDIKIVSIKCGMQHTAALSYEGEVFIWGKFQGGKNVDAFWPHKMKLGEVGEGSGGENRAVEIATASHQTAVLMEDNSVRINGLVKDGKGETVFDFVEVVGAEKWAGREVKLYGGFHIVAVVDGVEAWNIELRETGKAEVDEEGIELDKADRWGIVDCAEFLEGKEGNGKIVDCSIGWKFGHVIIDQ